MNKILFSMLFLISVAHAKEVKDFNQVLIRGVQKDIQNDNVQAFERRAIGRMPASVNEASEDDKKIEEDQKFNKMNSRQIGPNKW